jgi:hypothetical protein
MLNSNSISFENEKYTLKEKLKTNKKVIAGQNDIITELRNDLKKVEFKLEEVYIQVSISISIHYY